MKLEKSFLLATQFQCFTPVGIVPLKSQALVLMQFGGTEISDHKLPLFLNQSASSAFEKAISPSPLVLKISVFNSLCNLLSLNFLILLQITTASPSICLHTCCPWEVCLSFPKRKVKSQMNLAASDAEKEFQHLLREEETDCSLICPCCIWHNRISSESRLE